MANTEMEDEEESKIRLCEDNIAAIIENDVMTPFEVINAALSYLRDEDGSMENKDVVRIVKIMLTDASDV